MSRKNFLIALLEDFSEEKIDIISDNDNKIMEGVKPAFGSPGGKFFVAGKLIALFPEHDRYVEPFIGGGSVLFRKKKTESEFINDKDEEIIFCFNFMQSITEQQIEALNKMDWKTAKITFDKLLAEYKESPTNKDPIYQFYRYVYVKAASDAGEMRSYDDRAEGEIMKVTSRLMKIKERLAGVKIENIDYKDFVKKYATESSFTFLDPPYPSAKMNWKYCPTQEEFESFTKTVLGNWMVTYEVCDGWKEAKYNRKILSQYNLAAPSQGHMTRKSEMVITNYPMKENTSFLEAEADPEDMREAVEFFDKNLANIYIQESNDDLHKELKSVLRLYAKKRRGQFCRQSFEQIKASFKKCMSNLIASGNIEIHLEKMPSFSFELFDKYTDYGYSVPQPDNSIKEFKTLKELKDSGIDYRGYKFHIKMKEAQKDIGNFNYIRQWWKNKAMESQVIENFIITTDLNIDICLDKDILQEGFKESIFYIKQHNPLLDSIKESISFIEPDSMLNMTAMPSWIKKVASGKVSILESSEVEKIIEFSGDKLKGIFVAKRDNENSDFWTLKNNS